MRKFLLLFMAFFALNATEFSDQYGNKLKFDRPINSLALFPVPLASFSLSVENNTSRIACIHPIAQKNIKKAMLGKMIKNSANIPTGGINDDFMPNIEELIKLSPDLSIQWGMRGEKLYEPLQKAGLKVALVSLKGKEEDAIFWFDMLGKIYGKQERVKEILANRATARQNIESFASKQDKKPKVMLIFGRDKSFEVAGNGTYFDYTIRLSGGINAAKFDGFKIVNKEEIIAQNPDIILLSNFDELTPKTFFDDKILKSLKAVKQKAVYKMPIGGDMWEPPTGESHLGWTWMSSLFFGADHKLKEQMKLSYKLLYDYDLSDDEVSKILRFDINGDSKNYEIFK